MVLSKSRPRKRREIARQDESKVHELKFQERPLASQPCKYLQGKQQLKEPIDPNLIFFYSGIVIDQDLPKFQKNHLRIPPQDAEATLEA